MPTATDQQLTEALHELGHKLDDVRVEMTRQFGVINASLESLRVRLDDAVSVTKWTIGILAPVLIALIGGGFWLTWHGAKLDSRVERVESRVSGGDSVIPVLKR